MPNNQLEKEIFIIFKTGQPSNSLNSVKKNKKYEKRHSKSGVFAGGRRFTNISIWNRRNLKQ